MALRSIIYADNPHLRERSKKIKTFGPALERLVKDMVETLHEANGLGLAAPQIDVLERVIVIEMPKDEEDPQSGKLFAIVNPEIVRAEGEEEGEEGCLSIPGWWGLVKRAEYVTVKGQDVKGKATRIKADGLLARVFQHEIDHLEGILFIDRVESPDKLHRVEPKEPDGEAEEPAEAMVGVEMSER
jgi:peptide deformylase